jgi:hypothetical protein
MRIEIGARARDDVRASPERARDASPERARDDVRASPERERARARDGG